MSGFSIIQNIMIDIINFEIVVEQAIIAHIIPSLLVVALMIGLGRYKKIKNYNHKLNGKLLDLHNKLNKFAKLLSICSYCRGLQLDPGEWMAVEDFFRYYFVSDVEFSHGICKTCKVEILKEEMNSMVS